eukprot:TRINITY_DN7667_c0_g1_i1.p1 TRINITY_DN7667_c0_g1~~TRINITY_DN7667_c0_g1_i1.p1  ORF type:complete len:663 (+),score=132.14 TRINITY_DN7667_c0_g1_i1:281-1990(+)
MYFATTYFMLFNGGFSSDFMLSLVSTPFFVLQSKKDVTVFVRIYALVAVTVVAMFLLEVFEYTDGTVLDVGISRELMRIVIIFMSVYQVVQFIFLFSHYAGVKSELMQKIALHAHKSYELANERNITKRVIIATMSHEIRTPLNSMFAAFQLLNDQKNTPYQRRLLDVCNNASTHLLTIVNSILNALTVESGVELHETQFSFLPFIQDLVNPYRVRAEEGNRIFALRIDPIPSKVKGDATRLKQILQNLLDNAFRFSQENGKISLTVRRALPESPSAPLPPISVTDSIDTLGDEERELIRFIVSDDGIGIHKDHIPLIFDSFYQVDPEFDSSAGTGLGLGIVKNLVKLFKGSVRVDSTPGKGSTFIVDVNLLEVDAEDSDSRYSSSHSERSSSHSTNQSLSHEMQSSDRLDIDPHIMIVDDNIMNQTVLKMLLNKLGLFQIDICGSGQAALDLLLRRQYDIMFLDLFMPKMNGIECAKRAMVIDPTMHICCVSASVSEKTRDDCYRAGMHDFISKPVFQSELLRVLSQLPMGQSTQRNSSVSQSSAKYRQWSREDAQNSRRSENRSSSI